MSRFPKITETFILYEILALEARGVTVDVHPLLREREESVHPEAARLLQRIRFHSFLSMPILAANAHYAFRRPWSYFRALFEILSGTFGSLNFFAGAVGIFPKSVRFAYEMERAGVQHVHAHFATHPTVAALIIHRLTGIPFSFTVHGHDLHVEKRMLAEKVAAARFAVAISDYNRDTMIEECGDWAKAKISVVHCGIDPRVFDAGSRHTGGNGTLKVLCVGRFDEVKGHPVLVEACRQLAERGISFECDLVGEGPRRPMIEEMIARAGLSGRVRTLGARPRPEVVRLLTECDVFALPSVMAANGEREGIPVSLMEAMAMGIPVVSSRLSGIPELVENGVSGILAEPGDASALADALERLAREPELRAKLGEAGRMKVLNDFDLSRNVDRLAELLAGAHRESRRPARAAGRVAA
jgi:glycosyltransferase involved in cell wall biosynthesis